MEQGRNICLAAPIVIVIDDDAAVRGSIKFALEAEGIAVRTYSNGLELLEEADLATFACFVIDQKLPGMTGLELLAALRERHITAPAILITSHPTIILQERAARAGIPIIEKPLLSNALFERVRAAIARPHP